MVLDRIAEWIAQPRDVPNNLTWAMGENIRDARQEAGLTQGELAERVHRRQAAISQIENGKMLLDVETLVYLAGCWISPFATSFQTDSCCRKRESCATGKGSIWRMSGSLPRWTASVWPSTSSCLLRSESTRSGKLNSAYVSSWMSWAHCRIQLAIILLLRPNHPQKIQALLAPPSIYR